MTSQPEMSDEIARRILTQVHEVARWLHRLSKAGVNVETRLEEPIFDTVLDAYGVPRGRRRREPLYVAFYSVQDRPLTDKELDVILQAAKEVAAGEYPDALEALRDDSSRPF